MSDFDPVALGAIPVDDGPEAWGAKPVKEPAEKLSRLEHLAAAFTDIPKEIGEARDTALENINQTFNPFSATARAQQDLPPPKSFGESLGRQWEQFKQVGSGLASIPAAPAALITGPARSILGHTMSALTGAPYEQTKQDADTVLMGLRPVGGPVKVAPPPGGPLARPRGPYEIPANRPSYEWDPTSGAPPPTPPPPPPPGQLGVTLSEGQATRDLAAIQREQAALRTGNKRATEFFKVQQPGEVAAARDRISQGFDQFGQTIAETPQQAAQIAQQAIQKEAAARKAGVTQSYREAEALPGEIHPGAFQGIGSRIKNELSARPEPVVIDDKLTPWASQAIQDVDRRISQLKIQNRADPGNYKQGIISGFENPEIDGITLKGVDQMRRRLSKFRSDAWSSGNATDGRAASAVVDAFDAQIDKAINGGLFRGDPLAIKAWNTARAAHADYRATFGKSKGDLVGSVVEKILNPQTTPNDVADHLFGATGINPNSQNVAVANRAKSILGPDSPEWSGVQQGLFSRLIEKPSGVTDFGPGKIANRINEFLTGGGKEMAEAVYSPVQRSLIKQYADLQRSLEVPQAGANWSNNLPMLQQIYNKVSSGVGSVIGHAIGSAVPGPIGPAVGSTIGAKTSGMLQSRREAAQLARQLPLVAEATQRFQRAMMAYNRLNSPPSQVALSVATTNLARALKQIGVDISAQAPAVSRAEDQQNIPRPPGQ